jgi:group I intron endonuclease
MFIYKITNKVNNKVYIGQSVRPIKKRFNRHINDAIKNKLDTHFARAIRKYGKDNFICEVIDSAKNQKDLTLKEQYWIQYYDSVKMGYNETDAISKCGGNTYASKTKEELLGISEKIRKSKVGKLNPNSKSVKCYNIETKEELFFETVKECQEYFGEKYHRVITNRVLNKTISLYKNVWRIAYADGEYGEYTIGVKRKRN